MYKALLIGCGNIGALYDLDSEQISTHAKAYIHSGNFELSVFDNNKELAKSIALKYNVTYVDNYEKIIQNYDCVSICTPTDTHFEILNKAINANIKVIICEKPVSKKQKELVKIIELYKTSKSKIIVNYFRRFSPAFINLKKKISTELQAHKLLTISIRYQKGFLNNCSHAIDLIQFLFNCEFKLKDVEKRNEVFDYFIDDPTISLNGYWENVFINISGLVNISYNIFEIDLFFDKSRISILNSGDNLILFNSDYNNNLSCSKYISKEYEQNSCIKNYMQPVVLKAVNLLKHEGELDNFIESALLNFKMLKY